MPDKTRARERSAVLVVSKKDDGGLGQTPFERGFDPKNNWLIDALCLTNVALRNLLRLQASMQNEKKLIASLYSEQYTVRFM
jgi:hypothetical protein